MKTIYKSILAVIATILLPSQALAQHYNSDSTWIHGGNFGVTANQLSQVNWAAGGENTFGVNVNFDYAADYKADKHLWNTRLELEYGFTNTESDGYKKSSDKIYLSSTYGYEIGKNLYFSGSLSFNTQFTAGYDYKLAERPLISTFMAPGYLTAGIGLTWTPKSWFTATFNPATYRGIFVLDQVLADAGQYGVAPGQQYKTELGANLKLEGKHEIMKNVELFSRLSLFSDYMHEPANVDVNWDLKINLTINEWLSANVGASIIYDHDVMITDKNGTGPRLQFQELIGVGLRVKL